MGKLTILILLLCILTCTSHAQTNTRDTTAEQSQIPVLDDEWYISNPVGQILPNDEDSTLIKAVYGSYTKFDSIYIFRGNLRERYGPVDFDTITMSVVENLGDDSTRLISIRGNVRDWIAMPYAETRLLLHRVEDSWKVMDMSDNPYYPLQWESTKILGTYNMNYFLVVNGHLDNPNGGYAYQHTTIYLQPRDSLQEVNSISFRTYATNSGSIECGSWDDTTKWDCFEKVGTWKCTYDSLLNCFVIDYYANYSFIKGKTKTIQKGHQVWYFNADTTLLASGNLSKDWDITEKKIHLGRRTIKRIMKPKHSRPHSFIQEKDVKMESNENW